MPHDVIMPALGMAQDAQRIAAWHKQPGDAVKADDILMDVETDKTVAEVEAGYDGVLTEIRAEAGSDVAVGEVIAVIGESADDVAQPAAAAGAAAATDDVATAQAAPKGTVSAVIMPALGMAQDAQRIAAWHKQPGDAVKADDILMDVETDKTVAEVEAGYDGFVTELRADVGDDVPVGETVALIGDSPDAVAAPAAAEASAPDAAAEKAAPVPSAAAAPAPVTGDSGPSAPLAAGERILASPKARRLAVERGIDLRWLVEQGLPQPFHVADLDKARAPAAAAAARASNVLRAVVDGTELRAFADWLAADPRRAVPTGTLWAAFAAGSLRAALDADDADGPLTVLAETPGTGEAGQHLTDPDRAGLTRVAAVEGAPVPRLRVRDLTGTPLVEFTTADDGATPTLTVTRTGGDGALELRLVYGAEGALTADAAVHMLGELARRVEHPLRHLL